jgi:hypothetical protein
MASKRPKPVKPSRTNGNGKGSAPHLEIARGDLIFDWNLAERGDPLASRASEILDESLRDGIQSPSVVDPSTEEKVRIVQLM